MGWFGRWFSRRSEPAADASLTLIPGRAETRFGDRVRDRVQFRVQVPGADSHPSLVWTVHALDGGKPGAGKAAGMIVDPHGAKGVFLAFPVEQPTNLRVRVTLAGTTRYAEATVLVNPPSSSGGRRVLGFGMGGLKPLEAFF